MTLENKRKQVAILCLNIGNVELVQDMSLNYVLLYTMAQVSLINILIQDNTKNMYIYTLIYSYIYLEKYESILYKIGCPTPHIRPYKQMFHTYLFYK